MYSLRWSKLGIILDCDVLPKASNFFVVVQVLENGIALNAMNNSSCLIHEGEPYVKIKYLEKTFEGKNEVKFRVSKIFDPVFVNLGEIFATNIDISKALTIHISKNQSLCELIYYTVFFRYKFFY